MSAANVPARHRWDAVEAPAVPGAVGRRTWWRRPRCAVPLPPKRRRYNRAGRGAAADPHVRGEEQARVAGQLAGRGPPPRAWGRGKVGADLPPPPGSTPTCVGKRCSSRARRPRLTVHPHVRGEEDYKVLDQWRYYGPPPRAWGRVVVFVVAPEPVRSTPTCVGKSSNLDGRLLRSGVHPHVRGEEGGAAGGGKSRGGPPPRAWGRVQDAEEDDQDSRSTPTCVGKSAMSGA